MVSISDLHRVTTISSNSATDKASKGSAQATIDNDATLSPSGGAARRMTEGGGDADPKLSPTYTTAHPSSRLQNSATGQIFRFNGEVMQGFSDEEALMDLFCSAVQLNQIQFSQPEIISPFWFSFFGLRLKAHFKI